MLATGQNDAARSLLEGVPNRRFAPHIASDGAQPHELARTKSLGYSGFNLLGMFEMATLGERLGLNLWDWQGENGATLRRALEFLAPYASVPHTWPYPQIVVEKGDILLLLLRRGAKAFNEPQFERTLRNVPAWRDARFNLLWPSPQS